MSREDKEMLLYEVTRYGKMIENEEYYARYIGYIRIRKYSFCNNIYCLKMRNGIVTYFGKEFK